MKEEIHVLSIVMMGDSLFDGEELENRLKLQS